jgi:hypothetical protein
MKGDSALVCATVSSQFVVAISFAVDVIMVQIA